MRFVILYQKTSEKSIRESPDSFKISVYQMKKTNFIRVLEILAFTAAVRLTAGLSRFGRGGKGSRNFRKPIDKAVKK